MKTSLLASLLAVAIAATSVLCTPAAGAEPSPKANAEAFAAWRADRFGMFIHWGPVSLTEKEISWSRANSNPKCPNRGPTPVAEYDNLYKRFNPVKFDARQWVAIAKAAGMKYMILTAKHCDGFLLWDSKVDPYNITRTPFKRDVCAELSKAAREANIKIGWYFSPMDWRDPEFRTERNAAFLSRMQGEVGELLSNYGPIDILWFDWDGGPPLYDQRNTYALVRKLQPKIILTNRLDLGPGNSDRQILSPQADYYTPEQAVGAYDDQRPWESCMTLSRRGQWSWGGPGDGVKSLAECMDMLIRCAGGDGNMLLNVGPTPTGEIAPEQASRLREMGAWLAKYGESIYGTRGGPFKPGRFGVSTRNGRTVYLHVQRWPGETLTLPAIPATIVGSRVLTGGTAVVKQTAEAIEVSLPQRDRQPLDTIVALELDRPAETIPALSPLVGPPSLTTGKKATASNVFANMAEYAPGKAVDGDSETRWATDAGVKSAWLEVDLGKPAAIGRLFIQQAYPELQRVRKFALETWQDGKWQPCYRGENLGATLDAAFPPVTAQRVRLNFSETTDGPTIWEFELYPPKPVGGSAAPRRLVVAPVGPQNPRNSEAAIVPLRDGSLLLAWTEFYAGSGADHGPARIVGRVSKDKGDTWGPKHTLIENDGGCNVMEVNFLRLKDGRIALFYCQKNSEELDCRVMMRTSADEGRTWGKAAQLSAAGKYTALTNGRCIRLRTGRILLETYADNYSYCLISDDDGKTWRESQRVKPRDGCWEPACIELKDGRVLMLLRTGMGGQYQCLSRDGGQTWTEPVPTPLVGTAAPVSISRVPTTGDLLAIWNRNPGAGTRNPLTTAISKDEGKTWLHVRNIEDAPDDAFAYPAVTWVDNQALVTYFTYKGGHSLVLKILSAEWFYGK